MTRPRLTYRGGYWRVSHAPRPFRPCYSETWQPAHRFAQRLNNALVAQRAAREAGKPVLRLFRGQWFCRCGCGWAFAPSAAEAFDGWRQSFGLGGAGFCRACREART